MGSLCNKSLIVCNILLYTLTLFCYVFCNEILVEPSGPICWNKSCGVEFDPLSPLINCSYV